MEKSEISEKLMELVGLLVSGKFQEIKDKKQNGRLTVEALRIAITQYPGVITIPPHHAFNNLELYAIHDQITEAQNAEFDLWYDGSPSDLTLSLCVSKGPSGDPLIEIEDIHVL